MGQKFDSGQPTSGWAGADLQKSIGGPEDFGSITLTIRVPGLRHQKCKMKSAKCKLQILSGAHGLLFFSACCSRPDWRGGGRASGVANPAIGTTRFAAIGDLYGKRPNFGEIGQNPANCRRKTGKQPKKRAKKFTKNPNNPPAPANNWASVFGLLPENRKKPGKPELKHFLSEENPCSKKPF